MKENKIYGLLSVGGLGCRLGLPFPKEMLPQAGCSSYNPIVNFSVKNMELAGADEIVFVHGSKTKDEIVNYFNTQKYRHITQEIRSPVLVFRDFVSHITLNDNDIVFYGLADSVYDSNPFVKMLNYPGIVCGLFTGSPEQKLDRLLKDKQKFDIKSPKNTNNLDWFWGVIKFNGSDVKEIAQIKDVQEMKDVGDILNHFDKKSFLYFKNYIDIGTWEGYNRYLSGFKVFATNYSQARRH